MPDARQESSKKQPRLTARKTRPASNPAHQQSLTQFQSAVQFMQEGKFDKARSLFEKLVHDGSPEVLERSKVYLAVCSRQVQQERLDFATPEEQYDYAVSLLNTGNYEDARDQFEGLLAKNPDADY